MYLHHPFFFFFLFWFLLISFSFIVFEHPFLNIVEQTRSGDVALFISGMPSSSRWVAFFA